MQRREFLIAAAAAPFALSPLGRLAEAAAAPARHGLLLVTADLAAHVVVVDGTTGRVRRRIPTREAPRSIERFGTAGAVVAHTTEGVVSLIDGDRRRVAKVLGGFSHPRYTAVHPRQRIAYVTDSGTGEVVAIDLRRGTVLHRTDVGGPARHVSVSQTGTRLWTALGSTASRIAVLDTSTPERPRLLRRFRPPFLAHDVAIWSPTGTVWVTSGDAHRIAVYRLNGNRLIRQLTAGAAPQHVAFGAGRAFVASGDDGTVRVHAVGSGRLERTTAVPAGSYNVTTGAGRVATPSLERGTVAILDRAGHLQHERRIAASSHDACWIAV
jgi:DNA-binding beta-propeller fold protein YncE